jgi:hypothetical protein
LTEAAVGVRAPYRIAAAVSRMPRSARAYPAIPNPAPRPWLTAAVCDAGPRRIGFEMWTSTIHRPASVAAGAALVAQDGDA